MKLQTVVLFDFIIPPPTGNVGYCISVPNGMFNLYAADINPIPTTCGPVVISITGAPAVYNPDLDTSWITITQSYGGNSYWLYAFFKFNNTIANSTTNKFIFLGKETCSFNTADNTVLALIDSSTRDTQAEWGYEFISNSPTFNGGEIYDSAQGFTIRNVIISPKKTLVHK